jgi:fatty acid desaturase
MATPPMLQPRDPRDRLPQPRRADPATSVSAALLAVAALGLFLGAILAVYDWRVPGAEWPLFFGVLASFGAALGVQVLAATVRHLRPGR